MRPSLSITLFAVALATACGAERRATFDDNKGPTVPGSGADGGFVDFGNAADDGLAVDPIMMSLVKPGAVAGSVATDSNVLPVNLPSSGFSSSKVAPAVRSVSPFAVLRTTL